MDNGDMSAVSTLPLHAGKSQNKVSHALPNN